MTVARGAQTQVATFFASNGATVIHPAPTDLFEVPIAGDLPDRLNFVH
jgi:hypothetical protein